MDNVTHSLIGMATADVACAWSGEKARTWSGLRPAAFAASVLANNLPDVDAAYTWITRPQPLGSLLHHRGHTHTLLLALPMGLLVALGVLRLCERRSGPAPRSARAWVAGLGLLGGALHLLLDYGNNYGVHPFWPVNARWFYGDAIFIVEPLWLAALMPSLACAVQTRWLRVVLLGLFGLVVTLAVLLPFVNAGSVLALCAVAAVSGSIGVLGTARLRSVAQLGLCAAIALAFAVGSVRAEKLLAAGVARLFPELRLLDAALTPMPGNPLCWNALGVGTEGSRYRVLIAQVAPLPAWLPAARCPRDAGSRPTAPLTRLETGTALELQWRGMYDAPLASLSELAREDCRFRALLRFTRVPYVAPAAEGGGSAGDLRFDRSPGRDFADMALDAPVECPERVPPWTPPRAELFPALD